MPTNNAQKHARQTLQKPVIFPGRAQLAWPLPPRFSRARRWPGLAEPEPEPALRSHVVFRRVAWAGTATAVRDHLFISSLGLSF